MREFQHPIMETEKGIKTMNSAEEEGLASNQENNKNRLRLLLLTSELHNDVIQPS
jgi:hypothetical protein